MDMPKYKTDQEKFWADEFGNKYIGRNTGTPLIATNISLFANIIQKTREVDSVIEFGANIGNNLIAIRHLLPGASLSALEINKKAVEQLKKIKNLKVYPGSILTFKPRIKYDFVFTKGVLIHINPAELNNVYDKMFSSSKRYICIAEYYNPSPVSINYRGHMDRLFKRDFAGEMLDRFKKLRLIDYGFIYHRDNNFSLDDITWFLMEIVK